jgi:hypothetical protein
LERIGEYDIFEEKAIGYICKKIATSSSDMRKSLDILRKSILKYIEEEIKKNKKNQFLGKITIEILSAIHHEAYADCFALNFPDFPQYYKSVLYILAKYFWYETRPCTYRHLLHLMGTLIKKDKNQLKAILCDLRDLGFI